MWDVISCDVKRDIMTLIWDVLSCEVGCESLGYGM